MYAPGQRLAEDLEVADGRNHKRQQRAREGANEGDEVAKARNEHGDERRPEHDGGADAPEHRPLALPREARLEPALRTVTSLRHSAMSDLEFRRHQFRFRLMPRKTIPLRWPGKAP